MFYPVTARDVDFSGCAHYSRGARHHLLRSRKPRCGGVPRPGALTWFGAIRLLLPVTELDSNLNSQNARDLVRGAAANRDRGWAGAGI
jgi:hypothetical protein